MNTGTQTPRLNVFQRAGKWIGAHRSRVVLFSAIIAVLAAIITVWLLFYKTPVGNVLLKNEAGFPGVKALPAKTTFYSPLTGVGVANEAATKQQVTGIMLENSPDSRPQSGLKEAGICYEAIAEGGITRFACLYQESKPGLIGPVRSLRPYYLEWLAPYDAAIAHIGGSKRALDTVRNGQFKDIDQFFNAGAYWRATDRYAPHNVYTNFERLDALNQSKGFTSSNFEGFARKGRTYGPVTASSIEVDISGPTYNSSYTYDAQRNFYLRSQAGKPHLDREAGQITPSVVVVMKVNMYRGFEDGYREQIDTKGSGQAWIFQDGRVEEVTWQKGDIKSPLSFVKNGQPVPLNRGQTWITAIPASGSVTWK